MCQILQSMANCCPQSTSVGCFCHCKDIETGISSAQTGTYIIELLHDGARKCQSFDFTAPEEIIFSASEFFNENQVNTFQIKQPDGVLVSVDGVDCFTADVQVCTDC